MIKKIKKGMSDIQVYYRTHINAKYITFVLVFFIVNMFFLTSKTWYTYSTNQYYRTKLGQSIETPFARNFSIVSWDYSLQQKLMEVQLEVEATEINGLNSYNYVCVDRKLNTYEVKKIIESDTYIVLHILNIPGNWTELSLQIYQDDVNKKCKLYTNCRDIDKVDYIESKTLEEYYIARIDVLIDNYQTKIKDIRNNIERENININNYAVLIKSYTEQLAYVNTSKKEELQTKIDDFNAEIELSKSKIETLTEELDNTFKSIKELEVLKEQWR